MENSVMLNAVCNEPVSLKVVQEPFYRKGFSPFVHKQTGTWWEYDDDKKGFFDTGIIAQGRDGNDYVITEQDYNTIVERTLSNVNPTLDDMINVVKDDLSDLAPAGANVGQLFRVAAISEDGKYTMEPVDMLDVRIDGESIVQDGVANIPIANEFGKTGIVRLAESLGVKWSYANGGGLSIDYASIEDIRNRGSSNRPIIPYYLDYAVKAAMCDGKGSEWTADEQAAARKRIGIGDYELIEEITIDTDDITSIVRDVDLNGNPYNFAKLWVICECPKQSQNVAVAFGNGTPVAPVVDIANSEGDCSTNVEIDCTSGYLVYRYVSKVRYNWIAQPVYETRPVLQMLASTRLVIQNSSIGNIPNGTKFKIYGVRK